MRRMCAVVGVSRRGFYAWRGRPLIRPQVDANRGLRARIRAIHAARRGRYGSPRVHAALQADGHRVGRHRVMRLMRLDRLHGRPRRRFRVTTPSGPHAAPARNLVHQPFTVPAPNRVWSADITAIPTAHGWLYLAVVLDLYSRRVVGWALRPTLDTDVVAAAWTRAVAQRRPARGLIHHSDRGCHYTSARDQQLLHQAGARCSLSRRGNCFDNAHTETFFRTWKVELADESPWPTRSAASGAIAAYIERFYNRERLHSGLGYQSPARFEQQALVA